MSLEAIIYLADVIPNLRQASIIILVMSVIASGYLIFWGFIYYEETGEKLKYSYKPYLIIAIIAAIFAILTPSKEAIYTMAGVSATKQITTTPEAQKALKVINLGLDKAINKLQEKENHE